MTLALILRYVRRLRNYRVGRGSRSTRPLDDVWKQVIRTRLGPRAQHDPTAHGPDLFYAYFDECRRLALADDHIRAYLPDRLGEALEFCARGDGHGAEGPIRQPPRAPGRGPARRPEGGHWDGYVPAGERLPVRSVLPAVPLDPVPWAPPAAPPTHDGLPRTWAVEELADVVQYVRSLGPDLEAS